MFLKIRSGEFTKEPLFERGIRLSETIQVRLGSRSYPILIQRGLLKVCSEKICSATRADKIVILSNRKIFQLYGRSIVEGLKNSGKKVKKIFVMDGEKNKNKWTLFSILREMAQFSIRRDDALVALGGGVIGDLGGLAASLYMRGIDLIQCPTTLLAQVDASIGGKTAIDFFKTKNLIGTFHQPRVVLVDPSVIHSLPERVYRTGLAEIIKYGIIQAPWIFSAFEKDLASILRRDQKTLDRLIINSCRIKANIVSSDEREGGKRAWLNYGHTLGHALESYFEYEKLTHGEAIAYGMWFAARLSAQLGLCGEDIVERHSSVFKNAGLLKVIPKLNAKLVLKKLFLDKKSRSTGIHFILTRKIGLVNIRKNLPNHLLSATLAQFQEEIKNIS